MSELIEAARADDLARVEAVLKKCKPADIEATDVHDATALYYACLLGHTRVAWALVAAGARDDARSRCFRAALDRSALPSELCPGGRTASKQAENRKARAAARLDQRTMDVAARQNWRASQTQAVADPSHSHLVFKKREWTDEELDACFESITRSERASKVDFRKCAMGLPGATRLARLFTSSHNVLTELYLYDNALGDIGAKQLAIGLGLEHCRLRRINLCSNNITAVGCVALTAAIAEGCSLRAIDLNRNLIGDDGALAFAKAIGSPRCMLRTLSLRETGVTKEGAVGLLKAVQPPDRLLERLQLAGNLEVPTSISAELDTLLIERRRERKAQHAEGDLITAMQVANVAVEDNPINCLFDEVKEINHTKPYSHRHNLITFI